MARRNEGTSTEELERQMARVVCAQICKQAGFHAVRDSALNTLTEVLALFPSAMFCFIGIRCPPPTG